MKKLILSILAYLLLFGFAYSQKTEGEKEYKVGCIAFYNLENIFDTIDSPDTRDSEYLPDGEKAWNTQKYTNKLNNMADILSRIGTDVVDGGAAIIGVCEVENRSVLEDLVKMPKLKDRNYKVVHYDSPDERGVDVGLLYQPSVFKVTDSRAVLVDLPEKEGDEENYTRDILLVTGEFDGDVIHVLVNHWPSRWGGERHSRPLRNTAAKVARGIIDSIINVDPNAKIVLMGDLNDNTDNESVVRYLNAKATPDISVDEMYNPMAAYYKKGIGTTAYRDVWSLFDQLIISKGFLNDNDGYSFYKAYIYKENFMLQQTGRFKGYPKRTFAGGRYINGYSDHFPAYMYIRKEK